MGNITAINRLRSVAPRSTQILPGAKLLLIVKGALALKRFMKGPVRAEIAQKFKNKRGH